MDRLYIIPDRNNIEASLEISEKYGAHFEYNDFFMPGIMDDDNAVSELISFYKELKRSRSKDTLHGAFFDIAVHSQDALIRSVSDKRIRKSMDIASELGVCGVIFHTNIIPNFKDGFYVDGWVTQNAAYWRALASDYPSINIYIENMFDIDPSPIARLMHELDGVPNISLCFDYAHASVFGSQTEIWLTSLLPYASHLHFNDNDGVCDSHLAIGEGVLDYSLIDRAIRSLGITPSVLIETRTPLSQISSIEYLKKNGFYPFENRRD